MPISKDSTNAPESPMNRIGVIGDVHGEHEHLNIALDFLRTQKLDAVVCTGDVADGPGDINRCCDLLIAHDVLTVRGNHDRWLLSDKVRHIEDAHSQAELSSQSQEFLQTLPQILRLDTAMGPLLLCHGMGHKDQEKIWPGSERMPPERSATLDSILRDEDYKLLINGHMHYRTLIYFRSLTLLNAGTLRARHRPGFSVIDFQQATVSAYEFSTAGCSWVCEHTLTPHSQDRVWHNTAEFDGHWQPKTLYSETP